MPTFDRTPDRPEDFGFKISWFAAKATDPAGVLDALQFKEATPANWASGLAAAYWMARAANSGPLYPRLSAAGFWSQALLCRIPPTRLTMISAEDLTCCFPV